MTRLLLATLVALAATAHSLPVETVEAAEVTTSAATRSTFSVWSAAKHFFGSRLHLQHKLTPQATVVTSAMPTAYGVDFKRAVTSFCAKPENKQNHLCSTSPTAAGKLGEKPTVADSKAVFVAYCADKKNKAKPVCQMSRVSRSAATHKPTLAPSSAATASAVPALVPSSASPTKPKKHESGTAEKQKAKRSKSLFG